MSKKTTKVTRGLAYPDLMKLLHLVGRHIQPTAEPPKEPHWDRKKKD
jgi:hypothetical protein